MLFRTTETAYEREIELASSNIVLFRASPTTERDLPSTIPFAIPLTPDVPQCIHTPHSSLTHVLTATLHPTDPDKLPISKATVIHTRRYTSHSNNLEIVPENHTLNGPTRVEVEIPRASFKAGEPIPLYVKVPPPRRELVVDEGLRLRNIRTELIRVVQVKREGDNDDELDKSDAEAEETTETDPSAEEGPSGQPSTAIEKPSGGPWSPLFQGASYKTIVSRSGASCRFHSSRPVQLRFVLRQPPPSVSTSDQPRNLPESEYGFVDVDGDCSSITQSSLLHSVSFRVSIHVSFVDMTNRTERFSTISIPIVIVPPPAPLPEVEESVDAAYQKKHDKPPARTVRLDDDVSAPRYHEGEAGPSVHSTGAPPPFEERDAPPPFSHSQEASTSSRLPPPPFSLNNPGPSTSSHLPTFIESETEIYIPQSEGNGSSVLPVAYPIIPGEGTTFGFLPSAQFDGHSEDMQRSSTPPPTLEMATRDTDVTELADLDEPQRTMEAIGIALEQEDTGRRSEPPPPPPAMDDPSDPPPSIDSDYRTPDLHLRHSPPSHPSGLNTSPERNPSIRSSPPVENNGQTNASSHGHAPPPYLVPGNEGGQEEHITRPPPYVDVMPPTNDQDH